MDQGIMDFFNQVKDDKGTRLFLRDLLDLADRLEQAETDREEAMRVGKKVAADLGAATVRIYHVKQENLALRAFIEENIKDEKQLRRIFK